MHFMGYLPPCLKQETQGSTTIFDFAQYLITFKMSK